MINKFRNIDDYRKYLKDYMSKKGKKPVVVISAGTCGQASGVNELLRITKKEFIEKNLEKQLDYRVTGCHGFCEMEPSILIKPSGTFYPQVDPDRMSEIIESVLKSEVLEDILYVDPATGEKFEKQKDIPFFKYQTRKLLSQNEDVDPIHISDSLAIGGYRVFIESVEKSSTEWIVDEVKESGLKGRGGAGFPTGKKWEIFRGQKKKSRKYIICNADEGDPGAYMDRSILEGNPHSIIEGMLICALGTGASNGIVYVRNEYPLAIKHLIIALRQARQFGLLGENILGSSFSFDIEIVKGAGAFVCGEETALIRSIEGKMGEAIQRPPFPVQKGLDGCPTIINNVETLANIPLIFRQGAKTYKKTGTQDSSGTKIFSLVGKVQNRGLVEVAMGTSIKEIIYDIGGGPRDGGRIKAVQIGGPSGGCIPERLFDLKIDYESFSKSGAIMGSGGMIVLDDNSCMVDLAKYYAAFLKSESCGKCFSCRKGTQRMYEILDDISKGQADISKLNLLEELAIVVRDTTMCGLGQSAPNPVLSMLKYFRDEYEEHINDKFCRAFVCKELVRVPCKTACPVGTEAWKYISCIEKGDYEEAYRTIRKSNPLPSICARVCTHPCEDRCRLGVTGSKPLAIRALKRFITDTVNPSIYKPEKKENAGRNRKVAVIGGGPAGLTASHYLYLKGYSVTLFDSQRKPGGMLLSAIPSYRLPRDILKKEIDEIMKGVEYLGEMTLGRDFDLDYLKKNGYEAVFICIGAHKTVYPGVKGEKSEGCIQALEYLKSFHLEQKNHVSGRVGVIGGGNSAVDAARVAIRQKEVESVTIFYRRSKNEMPAYEDELKGAIEEGIKIETLVSPFQIVSKNGKLFSVKFSRNRLADFDSSGRRRPVSLDGSDFEEKLDNLIFAIGEKASYEGIEEIGLKVNRDGTIKTDPVTLSTNLKGIFAGGDVTTGPNSIIESIRFGKQAAESIHAYINNSLNSVERVFKEIDFNYKLSDRPEIDLENKERVSTSKKSACERKNNFTEVENRISEKEAIKEANRCLRCYLDFAKKQEEQKKPESSRHRKAAMK